MKKILSVILGILLLLLPTVTAAVIYLIPETAELGTKSFNGSLTSSDGRVFDFNEDTNSFLKDFFDTLQENSVKVSISDGELQSKTRFSALLKQGNRNISISLFLSLDGDCFWTSELNEKYRISQSHADKLLSSQFASALYEHSSMPALITSSGAEILPMSAEWKYTLKDGSLYNSKVSLISSVATYDSSSVIGLSFSTAPDICTVRAYVDELKVYDGSLEGLALSGLEGEPLIKYEIVASWSSSSALAYFGEASYSFCVIQTKSVGFSIDRSSITAGEFIIATAQNVTDASKLTCVLPDTMTASPEFFKSGSNAYALIPFSAELAEGDYVITLSSQDSSQQFTVSVSEREVKEQADDSSIYTKLSDASISAMNALISSIGKKNYSDSLYAATTFYNYENVFDIRLGFGNIKVFSDETSFALNGVDFYCPTGENIPAFNNGYVCEVGEDALLGKYVVIEHGYGVKSWYCHLGEITVQVGKGVVKGDTVARSGISGLTAAPGFYLITTVFDVPVCPYGFYENNFLLPK